MTNTEMDIDTAPIGSLIWHCSYEDSGPDVGISIKLGDSRLLWCGEITDLLYGELENPPGDISGWWIILYDGLESRVIAKSLDDDAARDAFEMLSAALRSKENPA